VPYYDASDVVVFPSLGGDSMPATLIEAGLMTLPAVATPVDAIPEVVVDGITGRLVPIGDGPALGAAIAGLRAAPRLLEQMGSAARSHCLARYSIETVATQWADVLTRVASSR
jgi:glycosyltransferase involved in cell wall biosynthesis